MNRDSFIFHREWYEAIKALDDNVRFEIYDAIVAEAFDFDKKKLSPLAKMAMTFISQRLQNDKEKYESICRRNSANGAKGGRPKKTEENPNNPQNPVGILETQENPKKPKKADTDTDTDIQDTNVSMSIEYNNKEKDSKESKKKVPETEHEKQFEAFRLKYKEFGGKARGFETEYENLKKKHSDWKEVIPVLLYALEKENKERVQSRQRGDFFPSMKNLQTYINQRFWEAYSDGFEDYDPNGYNPKDMEYDPEFEAYRFYGSRPHEDVFDGYTSDNRPDGARVVEQCNVWVWKSGVKDWERIW